MNNRWPVSISNTTTPNDHASALRSIGDPLACSGDIYAAVPRISREGVGEDLQGDVAAELRVGGELLLSPQSVEIIKFGDPGSGR